MPHRPVRGFDDVIEHHRAAIARVGWAAQGVFPTAEEGGIGWCYTIGLHETTGQPELIMFGLPTTLMYSVI